jgi:molybdate transport system substrate-binding protein
LLGVMVFAGAGGLLGCGAGAGREASRGAPLRIAAASDLQEALPKLVDRYRAGRVQQIEVSYGASGQLARQIRGGAPIDLFLSANLGFVEDLAARGAIDSSTVRPYAVGGLVIVQPEASALALKSLGDLTSAGVRHIAIANPEHAPYGVAAREALRSAGLWEELLPRIVPADTVRQALQFVQSGNADAGIVGRAISRVPGVKAVGVDPALHRPIVQGLGVVAASENAEAARRFADYLLGDEAQEILGQYGFTRPAEAAVRIAPRTGG